MKKNKTLGWYIGYAVASLLVLSLATCIGGVIIKLTLDFLTWLF